MTPWLWTIGIVAIVWPVIVGLYFDAHFTKRINSLSERSEPSQFADLRAQALREEISKLQNTAEQQDALIALLWYKEFGNADPADSYSGQADLVGFFGTRPNWYVSAMESPGAFDTLCRHEDFPWSKPAEWLRR